MGEPVTMTKAVRCAQVGGVDAVFETWVQIRR